MENIKDIYLIIYYYIKTHFFIPKEDYVNSDYYIIITKMITPDKEIIEYEEYDINNTDNYGLLMLINDTKKYVLNQYYSNNNGIIYDHYRLNFNYRNYKKLDKLCKIMYNILTDSAYYYSFDKSFIIAYKMYLKEEIDQNNELSEWILI